LLSCTHRAAQEGAFSYKALIKLPAIGQLKKELFLSPDEGFSSCGDPHNKYHATVTWFWVVFLSFCIFCLQVSVMELLDQGLVRLRVRFGRVEMSLMPR
jgi:hypothetical protein